MPFYEGLGIYDSVYVIYIWLFNDAANINMNERVCSIGGMVLTGGTRSHKELSHFLWLRRASVVTDTLLCNMHSII